MYETDLFLKRFKAIESAMSESKLIDLGKKAFLEEIKSDELGEMEKAQAAASFLSQIVTSALNIAAESALRVGISYEEEKAKKENTYNQSEMFKEQIAKVALEKKVLKLQTNNESERLKSIKADLEIKFKQLSTIKVEILKKIEDIKTLNKTADDNLRIKAGELLMQFMQVALSKDWVQLDNGGGSIYTYILNQIKSIITDSKKITLDTSKFDKIINETITDKIDINSEHILSNAYNVVVSNYTPKQNEVISIYAFSSDESVKEANFYINNRLIFTGHSMNYFFQDKGDYVLKVEFKTDTYKIHQISVR